MLGGIPSGVFLMLATSIWELGWHRFWKYLIHPHVDAAAYDLVGATLAGGMTVLLGLTAASFAAGAAVRRSTHFKHERLQLLVTSRLWFWPSTLLMYSITALASTAYGFPRYSSAILVEAGLGVAAWTAFVLLNARAAEMIIGLSPRPQSRKRRPRGGEATHQAPSSMD